MSSTRAVGFVEPAFGRQSDFALESHPQVVATIGAWAESFGYDAAIWTALASNFDEWGKGGEPFSVSAALQYLETLESDDRAKFTRALAYIRKAPPEPSIEARLGFIQRHVQYLHAAHRTPNIQPSARRAR